VVLVNEAAENVSPMDIFDASCWWVEERRVGRSQIKPAMWSVGVVVLHVGLQDAIEVSTAQDQRPVKELGSNRPHPSLSEGVGLRGTDGRADDPRTLGGEHGVEGARELGVAVADEETSFVGPFLLPYTGCEPAG
jgi:hypothetical protein